jgi:hypothetical protein
MLAKSLQAAAGNAAEANYIEDVFSTYLYTGNGSTQTITNGIDLAGEGGMVWEKVRNGTSNNYIFDTERGGNNALFTNTTGAQVGGQGLTFNSSGYTYASSWSISQTIASWTFREQPKFFDVVTYTGTGANRTVAHNLGSVPGCIIVKRTDTTGAWQVYHRANTANPETDYLVLNTDAATADSATRWNDTQPTAAVFSLGTEATVNASGGTYVAYLFAHDAGGFGLTGTDNVISCGSFTSDGSGNATVNLGYEPQWVMFKASSGTGGWNMLNTMAGWNLSTDQYLQANTSAAEASFDTGNPTATGFTYTNSGAANFTFIYIAIRRGPMKVPTTGTSVFAPQATAGATDGTPNSNRFTSNFPIDLFITAWRAGSASAQQFQDRLRSPTQLLISSSTAAETGGNAARLDDMDGVYFTTTVSAASNVGSWMFRRAPGFFDVVNSSVSPVKHNLGVVPELVITKYREDTQDWFVCGAFNSFGDSMSLNTTAVPSGLSVVTAPTATQFNSLATGGQYIYYIFASCPGVSKVGSYTGTAATQTINCGFTAGARFVLIKRTDDTGDWYVWDSARGIVAGDDPYLLLNSTAAEVTNTDYVDTAASGFELTSTAPADINASGGSFIFFAVA